MNTQDLRDELIVLLANRWDWTLTSQDICQACRVILFNNVVKRANEAAVLEKKGVLEWSVVGLGLCEGTNPAGVRPAGLTWQCTG